ncbi:hypothetical protein [Streptomyces sp. CBMA152]|uniref:hypothetical protein n=1 Tax=Streptomyces sp. CBMA152 TaxID=1896312 RepID=UPI001660152B|nr:hypothetical protein [Streptomyces sp. CBMA152]
MLRTPPPQNPDGTLLVLLLDTIVLAVTATARWHDLQRYDQQVTAAREALTHLQVVADQAAVIPLATLTRVAPTSATTQLRYEHAVRVTLPEHAEKILAAPDWDALAAMLARTDANAHDLTETLRKAADQRPLDDARRPARLLAWYRQHATQGPQTPRSAPVAPSPAPQPSTSRTRH